MKTRRFLPAALASSLAFSPANAQTHGMPDLEEMERSAREALRQLQEQLGPYLEQFGDAVGALDDYEAPRMLPNGDILIPRKRPLPEAPPEPDAAPDGDDERIDL